MFPSSFPRRGRIFLYWSIIALQCCVSFCSTTEWTSYISLYISLPSWTSLPSHTHPTHLGHHGAQAELPVLYSRLPLAVSHMVVCLFQYSSLNSSYPLLSLTVSTSPFSVSVSLRIKFYYSPELKQLISYKKEGTVFFFFWASFPNLVPCSLTLTANIVLV